MLKLYQLKGTTLKRPSGQMSNIYNNSFNIFCLGNKDEMTYTMFNADKHKDTNDNVTVL
jgi:hypothetical protein